MPKKGQPPQTYQVDAPSLVHFAARLEYVARRYREIAGKIPDGKHILVTGKPTAEKSQGLLEGWMATLQGGLDALELSTPPGEVAGRKLGQKAFRDAKRLSKQ